MIGSGAQCGKCPMVRRERRIICEVRIGRSDALYSKRFRMHSKHMGRRFLKRGEINAIRTPIDDVAVFVELASQNAGCSAGSRYNCNMRVGIEKEWIAVRSDKRDLASIRRPARASV